MEHFKLSTSTDSADGSSFQMAHYPPPDAPILDPQMAGIHASPYPNAIPPQNDVDDFLRKKRKAREHKACYPCRQRKVKCDLSRPCQTCRDRDHPELCNYHPPNKRQNLDQGSSLLKTEDVPAGSSSVTLGRGEFEMLCNKLNGLEDSIADLRREISRNSNDRSDFHDVNAGLGVQDLNGAGPQRWRTHTEVHGMHAKNDAGEIVHFGGGSIPAMLYALGQGHSQNQAEATHIQDFLGRSVLPLFGLDNESATYPFVDLWGLPHGSLQRARELAKALPNDTQILSLFSCYRDMGYLVFPGIADPQQFEHDLTGFLINRAAQADSNEGVTEQEIFGKTLYWLAVLFAVLASGAQCSGMPRTERQLTSQVYVCCAFECLRFTNFLSQAHLESIQALLVIGNVMANNMNAGSSWSLLGLTIRLAQGLGLHRQCPPGVPTEVILPRSKIWWSIMWQDSLLSITYDRGSSSAAIGLNTMPMPQLISQSSVGAYHSVMYHTSKVGLDIVRDRSLARNPREHYARIVEHRDAILNIMRDSAEYLRDSRKCTTSKETLEHWSLYLHTSYLMSELCRPAISLSTSDPDLSQAFKQLCIDNLTNTVEAYLGLNNITSFVRQSWAVTYRALSSALLLGILGEHTRNGRARRLIARFVAVMGDIVNNVDPQEISAPVQRSINALRKLDIQEIAGSQPDVNSGPPPNDATSTDEDGSITVDHSSIITPANTETSFGEDHSPYSTLNTILWGNVDPIKNPETFVV